MTSPKAKERVLTGIELHLDLEEIEKDLYRSKSLWKPIGARAVFGGQVIGQALLAASKTVSDKFFVHSLHAYFLLPGDDTVPILYKVVRIREGKSFCNRNILAKQKGRVICQVLASFQVAEEFALNHQTAMPEAPDPDSLPTYKEIAQTHLKESVGKSVKQYLTKLAAEELPVDIRNPYKMKAEHYLEHPKVEPRQLRWIKAVGKLDDDLKSHQCAAAYISDHILIGTCLLSHGITSLSPYVGLASLDHNMYFHSPFRADEWMLYEMESPRTGGGRGLAFGRIFTRDGTLAITCVQEGRIWIQKELLNPDKSKTEAKL